MYVEKTTAEKLVSKVRSMERADDEVFQLMIAQEDCPDILRMIEGFNDAGVPFFGGIFPGVIFGNRVYRSGCTITRLPAFSNPYTVEDLSKPDFELPSFYEQSGIGKEKFTTIIWLDGLSEHLAGFLTALFDRLGGIVDYFGGGAGFYVGDASKSFGFEQKPCVFSAEGFFQDGAVLLPTKLRSCLGVRHGWKRIMGPLIATRTRKNVIQELNWRSAYDVYRETVELDSGRSFEDQNFFDLAKIYPFGISKEGSEEVVRVAIAVTEDGALVCGGEVLENSVLQIMRGDPEALIQAAGQAAEDCCREVKAVREVLVADCISRPLLLENAFEVELNTITKKLQEMNCEKTLKGALTLGEISSHGLGVLEYLNKTVVIGALYEQDH